MVGSRCANGVRPRWVLDTRQVGRRKVGTMQIRDHAAANPDKPAVIIHPSGTVRDIRRAWRRGPTAWPTSSAGMVLREGDAVAILMENNEHFHAVMWAARRCRSVLRPDQHPPDRGRGGLHHRQQQRQGHRRLGGAAKDVREPRRAHRPRPVCDDASPTTGSGRLVPATRNALRINPIRRSTTRSEGDLLQYSSGTTGRPEGHQTRASAPAARRGARHDVGAGRLLAGSRGGLHQSRPAVPHRAVGVVDADSGRGHHAPW